MPKNGNERLDDYDVDIAQFKSILMRVVLLSHQDERDENRENGKCEGCQYYSRFYVRDMDWFLDQDIGICLKEFLPKKSELPIVKSGDTCEDYLEKNEAREEGRTERQAVRDLLDIKNQLIHIAAAIDKAERKKRQT